MHRGGPAVPWQAGGRLQVPLTPQRVRVVRGTAVKPGRHTYCATAPAAVDENCTSAWTTWGGGPQPGPGTHRNTEGSGPLLQLGDP